MEENKSSAEVKTKSKKQEIVGIVILSIFLAISIVIFGIIWSFNIDDFMASLSGDKKDATVLVAAWVAILFLILFFFLALILIIGDLFLFILTIGLRKSTFKEIKIIDYILMFCFIALVIGTIVRVIIWFV